jgi:hypothetical protein
MRGAHGMDLLIEETMDRYGGFLDLGIASSLILS